MDSSLTPSIARADADRSVLQEQIALLYRQGIPAVVLTMINATVLAVALVSVTDLNLLLSWYALMTLSVLARLALVLHYRSHPQARHEPETWRTRYLIGSTFTGICWGLAGTVLFPGSSPAHQIITLIVVAGTAAGATNFQAPVLRIYLAYILAALLPMAIGLFFHGTGTHAFIGFVTLVFLVSLIITSRRINEMVLESLRLRYQNADLIRDLANSERRLQETNQSLQGEIVEHTRTENELRDSYQFLKRIMDNATNAIFVLDLQGRFIHLNHVTATLTGYTRDDLMDRPFGLLFAEEQAPEIMNQFDRTVAGAEAASHCEAKLIRRNGEHRNIGFNLAPLYEGERISAVVGTAEDITERKKIDRLKNDFISTVSHELRTPLTSIRGSLGLLHGGSDLVSAAESKSLVEIAYKNTDRLINLINDLLDIQKLEAGEMRFKYANFDLASLIDHTLTVNRGLAEEYDVNFDFRTRLDNCMVRVDMDRFEQVVSNVLSNAVKFSPQDADIALDMERVDGWVRLSITDRGPGIPEEFQDQVFKKFAQADSSSARRKGGTGLGLSITKGMIEHMGGHIDFETHTGVGTTFHLEFPLVE